MPAISIVVPYFNSAHFVQSFVLMLQRQSYKDWICVLVDDQSCDAGAVIAARVALGDDRFQLFTFSGVKASSGPAAVRNFALARVCTPLVAFCDIDDLWHPLKLERQLAFHESHKLDLSVTGYWRFQDVSGFPIVGSRCPPAVLSYRKLLGGNPIPMLSVIVHSDLVRGGMPEGRHEDFALWLNVFKHHPTLRYGCLPEGLAFYRIHGKSLTRDRWKMPLWSFGVFWRHGLRFFSIVYAMVLWCFYQMCLFVKSFFARRHQLLLLSDLMESSPVRL